jgi:hypothetical protein|tara:strand:- start:3719 stop:5353 length:1635 start_codon:yes stop_codon:yes gene_type:complete
MDSLINKIDKFRFISSSEVINELEVLQTADSGLTEQAVRISSIKDLKLLKNENWVSLEDTKINNKINLFLVNDFMRYIGALAGCIWARKLSGEDKKKVENDIEKLKPLINNNFIRLVFDEKEEHFDLLDIIKIFDFFRERDINLKNIFFISGNVNMKMLKNPPTDYPFENVIGFDIQKWRFPYVFNIAYKPYLPFSDEQVKKIISTKRDFKFLSFNGTPHSNRTLLVSYLVYNKLHEQGLVSFCVHTDSVDSKGNVGSEAQNYYRVSNLVSDWRESNRIDNDGGLKFDKNVENFIINDFHKHLPLILDKGPYPFLDDNGYDDSGGNGLIHITHNKYNGVGVDFDIIKKYDIQTQDDLLKLPNLKEKRTCQQWIAGKQCEEQLKRFKNGLPFSSVVENLAGEINYFNSYFSIVAESPVETYEQHAYKEETDESYVCSFLKPTEKTYRALIFHPVIILGPAFSLRYLRDQGFETFPEFFDESYDEIKHDLMRWVSVIKQIKKLCQFSIDELHEKYVEVLPKIIHNQNVLLNIDSRQYLYDILRNFK